MMPINVGYQSVVLAAAIVADVGTGLERIFERRIPVAATVAAGDQQTERQNGKDEARDPRHRTTEYAHYTIASRHYRVARMNASLPWCRRKALLEAMLPGS